MARMIPQTIHSDVRSGAEKRVFRWIERAEGTDNWVCLHSLGLARHDGKRRGEVDFVLITPQGVFVLEVKGGGVRRDAGTWIFTDKYGVEHRSAESPFDQASSAMFSLERDLIDHFGDSDYADALFGYGVVLPDVTFEATGCEADADLVFDIRDRARPFARYFGRLAAFTRSRQTRQRHGLTARQIDEITRFLRADFDLIPSLSTVLHDTGSRIAELTSEQRVVLDALAQRERAIIEGPAGSGKTILALEAARREGRRGLRVLMLCYNKFLARRIQAVIAREAYAGDVVVRTVHGHLHRLIELSSLADEFNSAARSAETDRLFDCLYPEYAGLAALETPEPLWDALVLDEAQDVLTRQTVPILGESLQGGLVDGRWRLFLDANNQACVYGRMDADLLTELRGQGHTLLLTMNCRNTRPIAIQTNVLSEPEFRALGVVDGPPVEFLTYADESGWIGKLERVLAHLRGQGVLPGQISVLLPKSPTDSQQRRFEKMRLRRLHDDDVGALGTEALTDMTWSPVSGFKGLENDVVILADVQNIEGPWWRSVTYVGMSRARTQLYVILHEDCEPVRTERLRQELARVSSVSEAVR